MSALIEFVVSEPARVYADEWQVGDTLVWDNRALLHRATPCDVGEARVLIGTRIAGNVETELAYYPTDAKPQAGRHALAVELELLRRERT